MIELRSYFKRYLPEKVKPYSIRHLKRLLLHFKKLIQVVEVNGRSNFVTLDEAAAKILNSTFMNQEVTCDGMYNQVSQVGVLLK